MLTGRSVIKGQPDGAIDGCQFSTLCNEINGTGASCIAGVNAFETFRDRLSQGRSRCLLGGSGALQADHVMSCRRRRTFLKIA
jgi:hypothetical protein